MMGSILLWRLNYSRVDTAVFTTTWSPVLFNMVSCFVYREICHVVIYVPTLSPWIKSLSNGLDITIHVITSQCMIIVTSSAIDCDIISRTKIERVRHRDDVKRLLFLLPFMDSLCHVRNRIMYELSWQTVSVLTWVLFWYLFPSLLRNSGNKHQNNLIMSTETVHHSSTYIILYISSGDFYQNKLSSFI